MMTDVSGLDPVDLDRMLGRLSAASTAVLTTHEGPDADGLGSELALARALRRQGKRAYIINPEAPSRRFAFLDRDADFVTYDQNRHQAIIRDADLLILVDTAEPPRAGAVGKAFAARPEVLVAVDHHLPASDSPGGLLAPGMSSTGEVVFHLLSHMGVKLDADLASPLYAAILYDTNQFRFTRNTPHPFRVAADLVAAGADAEEVGRQLFGTVRRDAFALLTRVFDAAKFEEGGALVWASVTKDMLSGLKVDRDEVRETVMALARMEGVVVAAVFKELGRAVKLSMRSRPPVAIGALAQDLGGGGHAYAAGADMDCDLNTALEQVLPRLRTVVRAGLSGQGQARQRSGLA